MADLASLLYDRFSREILSWGPESTSDIYALSVFFDFSAGKGAHFTVHLSFNTNNHYAASIPRASSPAEAKWNYAFWLQQDLVTVDTGTWIDEEEELPAEAAEVRASLEDIGLWRTDEDVDALMDNDEEAYEEWNEAHFEAIVSACAAAARRLHEEGIILGTFGHQVPIIVHDLEYPMWVLDLTREANPPGLADEFLKATADGYR